MIQASSAGHTSVVRVRLLLTKKNSLENEFDSAYDFNPVTPALHAACKNGHLAVAELLVDSGVKPSVRGPVEPEASPLHRLWWTRGSCCFAAGERSILFLPNAAWTDSLSYGG